MNRFNVRYYLNVCAIALLLLVGMSSCDPAQAASFDSQPGQTMDQFVVSIARKLELIGKAANAEACGAIITTSTGYTVSIHTGNVVRCTVAHDADAVLVHTHLPYMGTRFSPADYSHPGYMIRNGVICYNAGERGTEAIVTASGRRGGSACAASSP